MKSSNTLCRKITFILPILFLLYSNQLKSQTPVSIAGNGTCIYSGDGGPANTAGVRYPKAVFVNTNGDVYIAGDYRVRKIDAATGIITTVAGNGTFDYTGDGGPATAASMKSPMGVCLDKNNNIYISDLITSTIRKVDAITGIITTIAGNGTSGYAGDGGLAIHATLDNPAGITIDNDGNLYIADRGASSQRIRKIDATTGIITTVAGNGSNTSGGDGGLATAAGVYDATSVCTDQHGNLYIAQESEARIRKVDAATGIITTVVGTGNYAHSGDGGPATNAAIWGPSAVTVDASGNIYLTEYAEGRVRKVDANTGIITTIVGPGKIIFPTTLVVDANGYLYMNSQINCRVFKVCPINGVTPTISIKASATTTCPAASVLFTATPTNGGTNPVYQWKKNGVNIGSNTPTYSATGINNGDIFTCELTSNANCAVTNTATSNPITITVLSSVTPTITISADKTAICEGEAVTFTAAFTNGGTSPQVQWKINGVNVGTNSVTYTSNTLHDKDLITCELTSNDLCTTTPTTTSNVVAMNVTIEVIPEVTIATNTLATCEGATVTFTATNQSNSPNPTYQWQVNGTNTGTNSTSFTTAPLTTTSTVQCIMTTPHCTAGTTKDYSDLITITVDPIPVITFNPQEFEIEAGQQARLNAHIAGTTSFYEWTPANALQNPSSLTPLTTPLSRTTTYQLKAFNGSCQATKEITVKVIKHLFMPNSFTPNGDGTNDLFRIPPGTTITLKEFSVFDRWGNSIFTTSDPDTGWNGRYKSKLAPSGTYAYIITGKGPKGDVTIKGTVILLR
jgi:gliding motility-associated-like protein